jgi:alkylated DNA nucleotide flippase Atl1
MIKKKFGNPKATIPKGKVATYGQIARVAGGGNMASRSVTGILGKAYHAGQKDIPFHRIVYADGRVWMSDVHAKERLKKYEEEGIEIDAKGKIKDFESKLFDPKIKEKMKPSQNAVWAYNA